MFVFSRSWSWSMWCLEHVIYGFNSWVSKDSYYSGMFKWRHVFWNILGIFCCLCLYSNIRVLMVSFNNKSVLTGFVFTSLMWYALYMEYEAIVMIKFITSWFLSWILYPKMIFSSVWMFLHVSPTFENCLYTFLPHSDLSHNNRSVISVICVFLTIIAYILHR